MKKSDSVFFKIQLAFDGVSNYGKWRDILVWGNKIKNEIQSEVRSVAESLKQMTKGNLDISLSSENYSLLFEKTLIFYKLFGYT